ncbi:MAG: hypothetical protein AAGI88_20895 [Pseudomonadota bacterium]
MKHASQPRLEELESLLAELRTIEGITEKKLGVFYRKSRAFLHFHEHGAETFADVRLSGAAFERMLCTTKQDQTALVKAVRSALR